MKVYLLDPKEIRLDANNFHRSSYLSILSSAKIDTGEHQYVDNIDSSDLIIACISAQGFGSFFQNLKKHQIYKKYKKKLFVYSMDDNQYPSIPGLYPSLDKAFYKIGWAAGCHYFADFITMHDFKPLKMDEKDILFSFVGSSRNHPIREQILRLNHSRAFLRDSSSPNLKNWWNDEPEKVKELSQTFLDITSRSKFCLCPRGFAPSSLRLFEAMQASCVPVIISDALVLPDDIDWASFSIQVSEKNIDSIHFILEELESKAEQMGTTARKNWVKYFSPESTFVTVVDNLISLQRKLNRRSIKEISVCVRELSPIYWRTRLRINYYKLKSLLETSVD
jgi:Exostosin family